MARMSLISKQKTSRINRAAQTAATVDLSVYCRDLERWPRSWMGVEKDVPPGEELVRLAPRRIGLRRAPSFLVEGRWKEPIGIRRHD